MNVLIRTSRRLARAILVLALLTLAAPASPVAADGLVRALRDQATVPARPDVPPEPSDTPCPVIPDESFSSLPIIGAPTAIPAVQHPDLNLALRGDHSTSGPRRFVLLDGPTDPLAPQLAGLFDANHPIVFRRLYQVLDWNWTDGQPGPAIAAPAVSMAGLVAGDGDLVRVPPSGYNIGHRGGNLLPFQLDPMNSKYGREYEVLVLYAEPHRITLKYTREDSVATGYTLQLEGLCVDPRLVSLYESLDSAGRAELPAMFAGQPFATALAPEVRVAIRDTGSFMDPRSLKDWWQTR